MTGKSFHILIAIPAFNVERYIGDILKALTPYGSDVLVVDDGSTDGTVNIVRQSGLQCICRSVNQGITGFYTTAFTYAAEKGFTHLLTLDSDGQHDPSYIGEFVVKLRDHDLVAGNRFHDPAYIPQSKIASNLLAHLLFRKHLGIIYPDVSCGFRGMKISEVVPYHTARGYEFIFDTLIRFSRKGVIPASVPIPSFYHPDDPLVTRLAEIRSLIRVFNRYIRLPEFDPVIDKIDQCLNFEVELSGFSFSGTYIPPDSYRFDTDREKAIMYYQSIQ